MENEELVAEVKTIGEDLRKQINQIEGQVKESGKVSEDTAKGFKDIEKRLGELEKRYGKDIADIALKMNLESLPFGKDGEDHIKALEGQIYEQLKKGVESGAISESATGRKRFTMENGHKALHQKAVGAITSGNLTDGAAGAAYSARQYGPMVDSRQPRTRVRQLLSSGVMSEKLYEYPQLTGGEGGAGYQVAEGDKKATMDLDWKMVPLLPKTIAVTADVSKQSMMDIGWLSSFLADHMQRKVLDKEDTELLNGAGGASALNGILTQAQEYEPTDGDYVTMYDFLVDAEAQLEEDFYYATGILLNPRDYAKMLIRKSDTGEYNHPGLIFGGTQRDLLTFNGIPIYKSSAITRLTGVIGDWQTASLLVREGLSFDISYENNDNFEKNMVTLRMEERVALAVYEPNAFVKIDFSLLASA